MAGKSVGTFPWHLSLSFFLSAVAVRAQRKGRRPGPEQSTGEPRGGRPHPPQAKEHPRLRLPRERGGREGQVHGGCACREPIPPLPGNRPAHHPGPCSASRAPRRLGLGQTRG